MAHHGIGDFHEAGNVGAFHIVDVTVGFAAITEALFVDGVHDCRGVFVDFFGAPLEVHGVLAHFKTGCGHTAGINGFAGSVCGARFDECVDSFGCAAHVGYFGHELDVVCNELTGVVAIYFVLRSARKGNVDFLFPRFLPAKNVEPGNFSA